MSSSSNHIPIHEVNFAAPRSSGTVLKSKLKETFLPDDPFGHLGDNKAKKVIEYFVPVVEWLPKYNFNLFKYDLLAGITIASLAIPQGISYAKLAKIPPIIGLCEFARSLPSLFFLVC